MSTLSKRTTVYLDPKLHKALRLQSMETSRSVSDLINEAIRDELSEDARDLDAFAERADEPAVDFASFVEALKRDGSI